MKRRQQQIQTEAELRQQLQTAQTSGNAATTADASVSKKNRKKLVVIFMCLLVCSILLFALSRMKYTTPEMRGKVAYEPALFNTVLLGNLVDADVQAVKSSDTWNKSYTIAEDETSHTQKITGKKLAQSLNVGTETELGYKQGSGNFSRVTPGNGWNASFPFTVTNGTTLTDDENNEEKTKNVAESDIRYTLHIVTSGNLPLTYQLQDLDTSTTYRLKEVEKEDGALGDNSKEYTVAGQSDENKATSDNVFYDGSRILDCDSKGNSNTVHRYQLLVNWPTDGSMNGVANNDLSYMKELENVEIRVEVESYVNYIDRSGASDTTAEGIMVLKGSPIPNTETGSENSLITYNPTGLGNVYAQKTVRYDNLTALSATGTGKAKLPENINTLVSDKKVSGYNLHICNGESISKQWVADSEADTSTTRKSNGHNPMNGHYQDNGIYQIGTYGVALAVPTGSEAGISSKDRSDMTYYLEYDGDVYIGVVTDNNVTTSKWTKKAKTDETEKDTDGSQTQTYASTQQGGQSYTYQKEEKNAYKILRFYKLDGSNQKTNEELQLSFDSDQFENKNISIYAASVSGYAYHSSKDDFRIYVYGK